jgi:hypothetical protein
MKRPLCSCGRPAEYSLCGLISTLGVRPRRQKCGRARLFCTSCMRELVNDQCHHAASRVLESLRSAYTALLGVSEPLVHLSDNDAQEACIRPGPALVSEGPDNPSAGGS